MVVVDVEVVARIMLLLLLLVIGGAGAAGGSKETQTVHKYHGWAAVQLFVLR